MRGGHARLYTPAKTVAYEGMVALAGQDAMDGREPLEGPLRVELVATFRIPASWSKKKRAEAVAGTAWHISRPDGDNVLKAIGDGLNGVVWRDDAMIASSEVAKRYGVVPGVAVTVIAL
jgi:Holliday junction resolvase RusA-like endonuclease